MTVITRPDFPAANLAGVMAEMNRKGDVINLATAGIGSAANLCGLLVQQAAGAKATTVVFRGTAPAIAELMAGRIDVLCDQATNTVPFIRDNRVKVFAVSSPQRLAGLPSVRHLVLPAVTLGLLLSGIFANALRLNLRRALGSDYVEAARSRGLGEARVVLRHALPNALLPVLTITGITVASLIGGALLIEVTYSWPGIAFRLQEAIAQRDYPLVQGIVVVVAGLVVLVTVAVDALVALLDPRISF
jgi:ABC-type antimicrobial peptide transport system permease subunit